MRFTTTVFLTFLLSSLGAYYYFSGNFPRDAQARLAPAKILSLAEGDTISALRLENRISGEKIFLRRASGGWRLESPVSYPAEDFLVEGMIRALTFSRRERRFPLEGKAETEFGFDSPDIKLSLETTGSPHERTFLVGSTSPVGTGVYARLEDENEYFLIPAELKSSFERSLYSLRQKKVFRLEWDQLMWIQVRMGKTQFRIEKAGEKWRWGIPRGEGENEISVEKVSELIYPFQALYIKDFLDKADPRKAEFGLGTSSAFLAAGVKGGRMEKLVLGAEVPEKEARYVFRDREDLVLLVSERNLKMILEGFEVAFQELGRDNQRKAQRGPGKNPKGGASVGEKPV